jgi:hypothetical protein
MIGVPDLPGYGRNRMGVITDALQQMLAGGPDAMTAATSGIPQGTPFPRPSVVGEPPIYQHPSDVVASTMRGIMGPQPGAPPATDIANAGAYEPFDLPIIPSTARGRALSLAEIGNANVVASPAPSLRDRIADTLSSMGGGLRPGSDNPIEEGLGTALRTFGAVHGAAEQRQEQEQALSQKIVAATLAQRRQSFQEWVSGQLDALRAQNYASLIQNRGQPTPAERDREAKQQETDNANQSAFNELHGEDPKAYPTYHAGLNYGQELFNYRREQRGGRSQSATGAGGGRGNDLTTRLERQVDDARSDLNTVRADARAEDPYADFGALETTESPTKEQMGSVTARTAAMLRAARQRADSLNQVRDSLVGAQAGKPGKAGGKGAAAKTPAQWVAEVHGEHPDWTAQQIAAEAKKRAGVP